MKGGNLSHLGMYLITKQYSVLKGVLTISCYSLGFIFLYAQDVNKPVNSNILIKNRISPKVLDAALSSTLQEGYFKQNMTVTRSDGTQIEKAKFQFIYYPVFKEGIDVQVLYNPDYNRLLVK